MAFLLTILKPLEWFNDWAGRIGRNLSVAAIAIMVIVILLQVFFRYVLNNALPWPDEAARFMMLWLTGPDGTCGAAPGWHGRHYRGAGAVSGTGCQNRFYSIAVSVTSRAGHRRAAWVEACQFWLVVFQLISATSPVAHWYEVAKAKAGLDVYVAVCRGLSDDQRKCRVDPAFCFVANGR